MIQRTAVISRVLLIRPGATEFDDQQRIKGSLDMPLSARGLDQIQSTANELAGVQIRTIYAAPTEAARATAERLAEGRNARIRVVEAFRNIDHGLWHGKLVEEVRRNHPRIYRMGIDSPEEVCAPQGELVHDARIRVTKAVTKCLRKAGDEVIAIVAPDPMAAVIDSVISGRELHDLWSSEIDNGSWNLVESVDS